MKRMLNQASLGLGGARARRTKQAEHQAQIIQNVKDMLNRDLKSLDLTKEKSR